MINCAKEILADQELWELKCYDCDRICECHLDLVQSLAETKECLEYFVNRVEEGSIYSKKTYAKFKSVLNKLIEK